jgi:pilus assembly protein CpaE
MSLTSAALKPEPAPIVACTISRDVQNFDLLIEDMEAELGETWGDLTFREALAFFAQPEAESLEFVAVAIDAEDEAEMALISEVIRTAKEKRIKVILVAEDVGPMALHQLLRLGADDFCPYPLPEGALREAIERLRAPAPAPALAAARVESGARLKIGDDRDGVVLPVHGLAGGVGASTFAVNLAWELALIGRPVAAAKGKDKQADRGPRVCLIDLDLQFGSISTYLDLPRRDAVYELLTTIPSMDAESFMAALLTYNERLHVLTAPADILPLDIVSPEDVGALVAMARSQFDFVVIDMPTTVVAWTETVLHAAQVYFALLQLDMRSAQNALRMLRALKAEDLPVERLRHVLNRAPRFTDLTGRARVKRLAESLDIKIELQLPDGGREVAQAGDHGLPLAETASKNPLRKEIQKLAQSLYALTQTETANAA